METAKVVVTEKVVEVARESEPSSHLWEPPRGGSTEAFLVG